MNNKPGTKTPQAAIFSYITSFFHLSIKKITVFWVQKTKGPLGIAPPSYCFLYLILLLHQCECLVDGIFRRHSTCRYLDNLYHKCLVCIADSGICRCHDRRCVACVLCDRLCKRCCTLYRCYLNSCLGHGAGCFPVSLNAWPGRCVP